MRYLSWLLSLTLHLTVLVILFQTINLAPLDLKDVMEVDLSKMEVPEAMKPELSNLKIPPPPEMPPVPVPDDAPAVPAPLPMDKTVVLGQPKSTPVPPPPPEPAPLPEPKVVEISPIKVPKKHAAIKRRKVFIQQDAVAHRGAEARFGRAMMADYYSYSEVEFSGQFKARDDRTVTIIDARETKYGRFLIYDSKHKTLRRLRRFNKYVYTIGPSIHEDEPVIGSVTFLALDDRIERVIYMSDDDRFAYYPRKSHVREKDVDIPMGLDRVPARISLPPKGDSSHGVVFVHGNTCAAPGLIQGFTRSLSTNEIAVLWFEVRGCKDGEGTPGSAEQLGKDVGGALSYLASLSQVGSARAGLWGNGQGVPTAIATATRHDGTKPAYLVCLLDETIAPDEMPDHATIAELGMPTLWLVTGRDTSRWQPTITMLEGLRDKDKKPFTIVVAPLKASQDVLNAKTELSGWVEQVTEDHAHLAVSWIRNINK
ncbi:hypothetical protein OAN24_03720 [Pseudodesulfovibrio sp.]|nr:hypothetical protein [Pseudodesulfovibrio sp.]